MTKVHLRKDKRRIEVRIINGKPSTKKKIKKYIAQNRTQIRKRSVLMLAIICVLFALGALIEQSFPYAVTVNGEDLCYVSREDSEELINEVAESYIPEGNELKAISSNGAISIDKCRKFGLKDELVSVQEAAYYLREATEKDKTLKITTISTDVRLESYEAEPNYKKDNTLLAGESKVAKKGKKGKQNVTRTYIAVNGNVESRQATKKEIVIEAKPATIKKGTLGLPEGEDWETYEGNPIYKDGEEVATTALNYLGAPYKYGGTSLQTGIDCVAFVVQMYRKYGINLPSSHSGLHKVGAGVPISKAQKGDIVCYSNHVSIYLGNGKVVEASSKGGVRIGKFKTGRVVTIRRIVD